jgi:hypothetical protein
MATIVFVVNGFVFILLGRWIYKNPTKLHPSWAYSNPNHPILTGFARVFAMILVLIGTALIASTIAELLPQSTRMIVVLGGSIAAAWILRPRIQEQIVSSASESDVSQVQVKRGFLSTKGKWVLAISAIVGVSFTLVIFALIGNSEICKTAVERAQSNPDVLTRLGKPVKQGLFLSGKIEVSGPYGRADVAIPLSGPKTKGKLYVVATKTAGIWKFETLQLAVKGQTNRIDLLAGAAR